MKLERKVAVITGASAGLGHALAVKFADAGCLLALLGRDSARLETLAAELRTRGVIAEPFVHDLRDADGAVALVQRIEKQLGPVALLVSNAGLAVSGLFTDIPPAEFRQCLEVNLFGPVALIRAALPSMIARREGVIVIVSSGVALRALPGYSPYSAAKAALTALADSLRVELMSSEISLITVYPGRMATEFNRRARHFGPAFAIANSRESEPRLVAERVLYAVRHQSPFVVIKGPAWVASWLHRFAPRLVDRVLAARFRVMREASGGSK